MRCRRAGSAAMLRRRTFRLGRATEAARADSRTIAAVVSQQAAVVTLIDVDAGEKIAEIGLPRVPAAIAATPDGRTLFITHPDLGLVSRVNVDTRRVEASFPVGKEPFGIAVADDGKIPRGQRLERRRAYPAGCGDRTGERARRHRQVAGRSRCGCSARGRAYVADRESNQVSVVDTATMERTITIPTGRAPFALALSPRWRSTVRGQRPQQRSLGD